MLIVAVRDLASGQAVTYTAAAYTGVRPNCGGGRRRQLQLGGAADNQRQLGAAAEEPRDFISGSGSSSMDDFSSASLRRRQRGLAGAPTSGLDIEFDVQLYAPAYDVLAANGSTLLAVEQSSAAASQAAFAPLVLSALQSWLAGAPFSTGGGPVNASTAAADPLLGPFALFFSTVAAAGVAPTLSNGAIAPSVADPASYVPPPDPGFKASEAGAIVGAILGSALLIGLAFWMSAKRRREMAASGTVLKSALRPRNIRVAQPSPVATPRARASVIGSAPGGRSSHTRVGLAAATLGSSGSSSTPKSPFRGAAGAGGPTAYINPAFASNRALVRAGGAGHHGKHGKSNVAGIYAGAGLKGNAAAAPGGGGKKGLV